MYFSKFPTIQYSLDGGVTRFPITDFLRRVKADRADIKNSLAYDEYDIKDGETPEILADKIYRNSEMHWLILLINEIIDPRFDWPMSESVLQNYIEEKYGLNSMYSVHHYENNNGDIVHSSYAGPKTAVTNFDYESELNESKRRIVLLKPQYVIAFVQSFDKAIGATV